MRPSPRTWQQRFFAVGVSAALLLASTIVYGDTFTGRVVRVADGDTITVLDESNRQHKVRLQGIDAPEKGQAFGTVSRQHLASLVAGKQVAVEWRKRDKYGRVVGKVLQTSTDAGLQQVRAGMAWHYKRFQHEQLTVDREGYAEAEQYARGKAIGLWVEPGATPPWEWRNMRRTSAKK